MTYVRKGGDHSDIKISSGEETPLDENIFSDEKTPSYEHPENYGDYYSE